ncbi:P-loop containing nucleoside triphosphate hydrolase protein [Plectosphaerella plurivora]|uniref:P-loop containing nucleoside triphosphate hydrolase protein n=1 Tax=Plectosphaerella plurivora TaxID=936078 RepID=A0A9P8V130_9PEZI|nr:P-loop containing nucleoside triphosphate hydrolase protein [Plectosphaerella plurivora]
MHALMYDEDGKLAVPEGVLLNYGHKSPWRALVPVEVWLGPDYESIIPTYLSRPLFEHQKYGVGKILRSLEDDFPARGCICGDEMGLGKTIQVITAIFEAKKRGLIPFDRITLVITTESSLPQWQQEIASSFTEENVPTVMTFSSERRENAVFDILVTQPDFLLMTYSQVTQEFKEMQDYRGILYAVQVHQNFEKVLKLYSKMWKGRITKKLFEMPNVSVHSEIWKDCGLSFTVILDEAQMEQDINTDTHAAIKAISATQVIAMTSTPIPHQWYDLVGMFDLLPGNLIDPVRKPRDSMMTFADVDDPKSGYQNPPSEKQNLLVRFMMGLVFCRSASFLDLPFEKGYICSWKVNDAIASQVESLLQQYKKLVTRSRAKYVDSTKHVDIRRVNDARVGSIRARKAALGLAVRAQLLMAVPRLVSNLPAPSAEEIDADSEGEEDRMDEDPEDNASVNDSSDEFEELDSSDEDDDGPQATSSRQRSIT